MIQYDDLCRRILTEGVKKEDRTGTGTLSVFGHQMRFNLADGFPLMTSKRMPFKSIAYELFWFLKGDTHLKYLVDNGVNIWNPDAHRVYRQNGGTMSFEEFAGMLHSNAQFLQDFGDLGRIYGAQWRSWRGAEGGIDQITQVIEQIKTNPDSRRHIVSAWNVAELGEMALPPCHVLFQFYVANGKLSCQLYQRSGDVFLGVPFNIASYAMLVMMIADQCGLDYGEFIHTLGDAHIYLNHIDQVHEQLDREYRPLPKLTIKPLYENLVTSVFDYTLDDFYLIGYDPHPAIKGKVSVG